MESCLDMCPEKERKLRESDGRVSVFEVSSDGLTKYLVKEHVRAGAGHKVPHPSELRPPAVLMKTLNHLIDNVSVKSDQQWHCVYSFIDNRLQSLRQDITYQQLKGPEIARIYETASKFYLYSQYRLWLEEKFEGKLNSDQLQQCLAKTVREGDPKPEFQAYYLLSNLGNSEVINDTLQLQKEIRSDWRLKLALDVSFCTLDNNYVRLFKLLPKLPPLCRCAMLPHITSIHSNAVQTLCSAYGSKNTHFPLSVISQWLCLPEAASFCQACGLEVRGNTVLFRRGAFKPHPVLKRKYTITELQTCTTYIPLIQAIKL